MQKEPFVLSGCAKEFESVFAKEDFNILLEHRQWDYAIKLILGSEPVTNFIRPYLYQFFNNSHSLNGYGKPLKRPFNWYQSRLKAISIGQDIRQIN